MKAYLNTHLAVAFHAVLVAFMSVGCAFYISLSHADIEAELEKRIDASVSTIKELADITDRNGADPLTERIIVDCSRRGEFDELLGNLNSATRRDLIATQQLFESCGSFYAERKTLVVAQLEREFDTLTTDLALLETVRDLTPEEESLRKWEELITLESERSAFLTEQTSLQAEIIKSLIEGAGSSNINELVRSAREISESLAVTDSQIDTLRAKLSS